MADPTLASTLQRWGGEPPEPTAIGRALMAAGIYPSSQLPYAKPMFEPGSVASKFVTEGLPLAMMGVRSSPGAIKGNDAVIARSLERQHPYEFPFRGLALDANGEHYGLAVDTAKGLSENPGMQPSLGSSSNPIWRGNRPGNGNAQFDNLALRQLGLARDELQTAGSRYPVRTMDPMVTRFLRALDGETPLQVQLPKLTVIEGGLPPRKD